jgi:hypothetical protein
MSCPPAGACNSHHSVRQVSRIAEARAAVNELLVHHSADYWAVAAAEIVRLCRVASADEVATPAWADEGWRCRARAGMPLRALLEVGGAAGPD